MTDYAESKEQLKKQLKVPSLLVGDRNLKAASEELLRIAEDKAGALVPSQKKIDRCNAKLKDQKDAAAKNKGRIAEKKRELEEYNRKKKEEIKQDEEDLKAQGRQIAATEGGELLVRRVDHQKNENASELAKENVDIVIRLLDTASPRLLVLAPGCDGAFQLSQEVLGIQSRSDLAYYGDSLLATQRGVKSVRALIALWVANGILQSQDWLGTFDASSHGGYSSLEWRKRHPEKDSIPSMRTWSFEYTLDFFGDLIGLPKASSSPSLMMKKRKLVSYEDDEEGDDDDDGGTWATTDSKVTSATKKRRMSLDVKDKGLTMEDLEAHQKEVNDELRKRKAAEKSS